MAYPTLPEALPYPVVGCRIVIPLGTGIVASTDPDAPAFSKVTTKAPVVHIEPQPDGTELIWWTATRQTLRAAIWDGNQLLPAEGWIPASFYRKAPKVRADRKCLRCAATIINPPSNQYYCSRDCQQAASAARAARRKAGRLASGYFYKPCPRRGCRRKGFCRKHYPTSYRRRAEYWGVEYEPIVVVDVYERDEWTCGLCLETVDSKLKHPDPMSVSLDHIIPLSRGGDHLWNNVQCSHLVCNMRKHNRLSPSISIAPDTE